MLWILAILTTGAMAAEPEAPDKSEAPVEAPAEAEVPAATIRACDDKINTKSLDDAMARVVRIQAGDVSGSGVLVSPDGLILTAAHVVASEEKVQVKVGSGDERAGVVVRRAPHADLALVRIMGNEHPCLKLDDSDPSVGSDLVAVGNPGGEALSQTVTRGIVSGIRMVDKVPVVQTDAAINAGNSGGPLLSDRHTVVGIVSFKAVGHATEGLGFAIASRAIPGALSVEFAKKTSSNLEQAVPPSAPAPLLSLMPKVEPGPNVTVPKSARYVQNYRPLSSGLAGFGVVSALVGVVMVERSLYRSDAMSLDERLTRRGINTAGWITMSSGLGIGLFGMLPGPAGAVKRERQ